MVNGVTSGDSIRFPSSKTNLSRSHNSTHQLGLTPVLLLSSFSTLAVLGVDRSPIAYLGFNIDCLSAFCSQSSQCLFTQVMLNSSGSTSKKIPPFGWLRWIKGLVISTNGFQVIKQDLFVLKRKVTRSTSRLPCVGLVQPSPGGGFGDIQNSRCVTHDTHAQFQRTKHAL